MYRIRLPLFIFALGVVSAVQLICSSSLNTFWHETVILIPKTGKEKEGGETSLHLAALAGCESVVNRLLLAGANVHAINNEGNTALHWAAVCGSESVVNQLLLAGADVHAANQDGRTALHRAAKQGSESVVNRLLLAGANVHAINNEGNTALHLAAESCNERVVKLLLQRGADFEVLNKDEESPLVSCASFCIWTQNLSKVIISYLISVGAGIDDCLNSDEFKEDLRPHVGVLKYRAELIRNVLKYHGCYLVLEDLIGQYAGFPISKKAVDKMEACLQ